MNIENSEYKNLSSLEEKLHNYLTVIEKMIKLINGNIDKLNDYINKKYNEIKILSSKKPTRINWMKTEDKMHMSLFFDKKNGFAPTNEDALKILQFQSKFLNYRKKYEYKKNLWTKKDIDMLFITVDKISKKYAFQYLIEPELSYELKQQKQKEIEESDTKNILSKLKLYFDEHVHKKKLLTQEDYDKLREIEISDLCEEKLGLNNSNSINYEKEKILNESNKLSKKNIQIENFAVFSQKFWEEVSENLKNSQTARECQKTWLYYGCFEDEKKKWTEEEIKQLLFLSKKYKKREWKCIARELNTNRSPLSCFEQYIKINKLYDTKEKIKLERIAFNVLEDIQLQILVSILGDKNWYDIKKHMEILNTNIKRIEKRKNCHVIENEKKKKCINDEISYKRRYLRLINTKKEQKEHFK
ncbi:Myb1-related transcription factor, putative [Plasmodium gallinaceum]|uniref:Myb1-related transcription factor, putative n=1 Tax=Plasmodium gallinaceum TaxID=5849 RepID=A0A1J1GYC0_PLAGA|nr:Myb1-related transcription factor, putative [Plasmodium gallinaceum]CRG97548.1 Myb1-related transcription factor, putative [Plasmodium gallinaceum]